MTNPYQSPTIAKGSTWTATDLAQLQPLQQQILRLRVVVLSLAAGVVGFGVFAIVQNAGKPLVLTGNLDGGGIAMLGLGLVLGILGIVLPGILFRSVRPGSALVSQAAGSGPEVAPVLMIQNRIQTATIVGGAMFEGGAFANLVWYFNRADLVHLAMAGLLLLGILARFPWPGSCERRIEDELRREREEVNFKR